MLTIIWIAALCLNVVLGAHERRSQAFTVEEIKAVLQRVLASATDPSVHPRYPEGSTSTTGYSEGPSTYSSSEPSSPMYSSTSYDPSSSVYSSTSSYDPSSPIYSSTEEEGYSTEPTPVDHTETHPEESHEDYAPPEQHPHPDSGGNRHPMQVGSMRGIPGINFPDYVDIPLTSFSCSDKVYVPGFYADLETGCQVFHVCWPHRRESFLCPLGTTFNQAILACDYWYSSNCSVAPHYYDVNSSPSHTDTDKDYNKDSHLGSMIDILLEKGRSESTVEPSEIHSDGVWEDSHDADISYIMKFLPVKAKVTVYPETTDSGSKIVAEASVGKSKKQKVHSVKHVPQRHVLEQSKSAYVPDQPQPTYIPHQTTTSYPKSKSTHGGISPEINRIIDQVFDIAKKIVREAEGLMPMSEGMEKVHKIKSVPVRKPLPLTKINPRFITEPVHAPKRKVIHRPVVVRPVVVPKVSKTYVQSRSQSKTSHSIRKPTQTFKVRKLSVSPHTKKALTDNYLKLLKIRAG